MLVTDDVATSTTSRREGADLDECKEVGERLNRTTASMGVALTGCTVPGIGHPTVVMRPEEIEVGVGIHGERGIRRERIKAADALVTDLLEPIIDSLQPLSCNEVLLHVNGYGGTPLMELYVLYHSAVRQLEKRNLQVVQSLVGSYTTCLDMAGASLTLSVLDDEMKRLWDAPVHTPALRCGC